MSIEQNQQILQEIFDTVDPASEAQCPTVGIAAKVAEYTVMCKQGQISPAEYTELLEDLQRSAHMQTAAVNLANLEKLNTAINGLVSIAKLV
jgi:hypothetical protein